MRNLYFNCFIVFIALTIILTPSCKKESDSSTVPHDSVIVLPPSTFTKKVLSENFLSTTCGYCNYGIGDLHYVDSLYPGKAISVTFHGNGNDPMHTPLYDLLGSYFQNTIIYFQHEKTNSFCCHLFDYRQSHCTNKTFNGVYRRSAFFF